MLEHQKIIVFDFETTGLDPLFDQIIEFGAILMEKKDGRYVETDSLDVLIQVGHPLPAKIVEITHITDSMLAIEGITAKEAFDRFMSLYDPKALLVAYNIGFDHAFLESFFLTNGHPEVRLQNDILDVMAVYKDRHRYPHRLQSAVLTYGVTVENAHRALDDVRATYAVLEHMHLEKSNIGLYVNELGYNIKYGRPRRLIPHVTYTPQRGGGLEIEQKKRHI